MAPSSAAPSQMNPIELTVLPQPTAPASAAAGPSPQVLRRPAPSRLRSLLEGRGWAWVRPTADAVMLALALVVTLAWPGEPVPAAQRGALLLFPLLALAALAARGTYRRRLRPTVLDGAAPVLGAIALATMATAVVGTYSGGEQPALPALVHLWLLATAFVGAARIGVLAAQRKARRTGIVLRPALVVGGGVVGSRIARRLLDAPDYGLQPVGFLDADPVDLPDGEQRPLPVLGAPCDLEWLAQLTGAEHVVLAFTNEPDSELRDVVRRAQDAGLEVTLVPRMFEALNHRTTYEPVGGLPLHRLRRTSPHGPAFAVKHAIDRLVAGGLVLLLSPVLLGLAAAVKLTSRGPVLFRQRRVGRDGRVFDVLKFRSMKTDVAVARDFRPGAGSAPGGVEGVDRRTAVGKLIRRTSLDELPQLLNVLRGDMSLVGPRPERPEFVELFEHDIDRYGERHRVKAGITGWAQVHGLRGQTSLHDRVEWDNFYIEHWSLALDLKVLLLTVRAVFQAAE